MRLLDRLTADAPGRLLPRWLVLRALGLVFLSAFHALAFQIQGLVGERGILPARDLLARAASALGAERFWYVPSLLWLDGGRDRALALVVGLGAACALLLVANVWPRVMAAACTLLFLSCVAVLQDFSSYQSDGMLLEAGLVAVMLAPSGARPGLGAHDPPSRAAYFLLCWEWFRIYFESGVVKLASGDPHWRDLTAMDEYYQNGPLPTWIGWYVQQLPHWYHAATVVLTLVVELGLVWALFLPRRVRLVCFAVVSLLQLGIIATANYAFLNYLVLALGVLLLDDRALAPLLGRLPARLRPGGRDALPAWDARTTAASPPTTRRRVELALTALLVYASVAAFLVPGTRAGAPARWLAPLRVANAYGLFATMTEGRWEIEFQGSRDGRTWVAYPFRYKPQDVHERPGIYAPYQPRFDWNLWFASLGPWQASEWVVLAQRRLIEGSPAVLRLFRRDPFGGRPPALVRTVLYRYWFTSLAERRTTGAWWRRRELGPFTGVVAAAPPRHAPRLAGGDAHRP